jgi:uncharacterized protein (TIGR01777 family)
MNIVICGSSGFIGKELCVFLESQGHDIIHLRRRDFRQHIHEFKEKLRETDVLINLAGAPILKRWTPAYKRELRASRIDTTAKILTAFKLLKSRPRLMIASSAIGIYDSVHEHNEESRQFGKGFLAELAQAWENEIHSARELADLRLVIFRLGVVLGNTGGAFPKMALPFRFGFGGRISKGNQAMSFIHIEDLLRAFTFAIENPRVKGTYNLTAPHPTTNKVFTQLMGKTMKRPAFLMVPGWILKLIYGKAASVLLDGQCATPDKLLREGFSFRFNHIEETLHALIRE